MPRLTDLSAWAGSNAPAGRDHLTHSGGADLSDAFRNEYRLAMRYRRLVLLGCVLIANTLTLGVVGTLAVALLMGEFKWSDLGAIFTDKIVQQGSITLIWLPASIVSITQLLFVLPVFSMRLNASERGRSMVLSVVGAALVAAILFLGLFVGLSELIYFVVTGKVEVGDFFGEYIDRYAARSFIERWAWWPFVLASWMVWTPILLFFCRQTPPSRLHSRLAFWLLGGTLAEVMVVVPLDIFVRRKSNCYCNTGTFCALVLSSFALLWLSGPGIVLALTSKRRRWWREMRCDECGYEKGPSPGSRCPECGSDWGT